MPTQELKVTGIDAQGIRLDKYCALHSGSVSRSSLKNGAVTVMVNGNTAKLSRTVRNGDLILFVWEDPIPHTTEAENIPLDILYEDSNITVVNKKQGMVTHPAAGNWSGTLVHALLGHWNVSENENNFRRGIVHRLDKDTSGIIITASNSQTEEWLKKQFSSRKVKKVYAAILQGVPKYLEGEVRTHLLRDPKNRKRFTWSDNPVKGKYSHTDYRIIAIYGNYALVLFRLHTGRTHQIRIHSKYLGTPILGDPIYGRKDSLFSSATLMLHSRFLSIFLPGNKKRSNFTAPTPVRFKKVMNRLHKLYPEGWHR